MNRNTLSERCGPWTPAVGVARTILALSTLLTLLANDPAVIFSPLGLKGTEAPVVAVLARYSLFYLIDNLVLAKWLAIAILAVAASGWRPRITGLLHWWVAFSFAASVVVVDGGDQVAAVLALLLLPVVLTDPRKWHWQSVACRPRETTSAFFARSALVMIQVQVCVIYLAAAVGKFGVKEWVNGTAIYYWLSHPLFGMTGWRAELAHPIITTAWGVVALTWGVMALELLLAMGVLASPRTRKRLFVAGVVLHVGIMGVHGLVSFGLAMIAALVLYFRTPVSCEHEGVREESAPVSLPQLEREEMVA
jgi:antimicrobial peptide system SdpB family protein